MISGLKTKIANSSLADIGITVMALGIGVFFLILSISLTIGMMAGSVNIVV